jgi:soluble lytic murein transglycosylase-like protein
MELVVFRSERSLVVERYEDDGEQVTLTLPGGGAMGIPSSLIESHYPGYVPPPGLAKPEEKLPADLPYRDLIAKYCQKYQMDWKLVAAVIRVESNFNPSSTSPKGAMGLMQLMPGTARELGVQNAYDPLENIQAGTRYLSMLLNRYEGNVTMALAAYNWGMGNVERRPAQMPLETKSYIKNVTRHYEQTKA